MKSKIQLNDLELTVISKNNKVESFDGDVSIKKLVKHYFTKPITVVTCEEEVEDGFVANVMKEKIINPGDKDYIMAALIEIRNDLNLRTEYNIKVY